MSFWSELKRRNVYKVGAGYVIVAWVNGKAGMSKPAGLLERLWRNYH